MNRGLWLSAPEGEPSPDSPRMVRVTHWPDGVLFPEGTSVDFSAFHARRHPFRHVRLDGREVRWTYRMWDPYSAYGGCPLPTGHPQGIGRMIDNVHWIPPQSVMDRMVSALSEISKECSVLWWDSAIQCFPYVARHLKRLFRLCILNFGDDLPGSSDVKTFPVLPWFDVLIHAMYVWDPATGRTVPEAYAARGLRDCRFIAWGPMQTACDDAWFARKMGRMRAGSLSVGLAWLGGSGMLPARRAVLAAAAAAPSASGTLAGRTRIHGHGMPGGWWTGSPADLYAESEFGLNVAESSLFNGRFADLCVSGTIQVAYDPHGELPRFGFLDGVHCLRYDGSVSGLVGKIGQLSVNAEAMAVMAEAARARFVEYRRRYDDAEVQSGVLLDYERQIREGRP